MTTAAPKRQAAKELTPERVAKLALYERAEEAWDSAYDRALESDRKHGRPYDRHRYARVAHEARARVLDGAKVRKQRGATKAQLEYREKLFAPASPSIHDDVSELKVVR